jgi:hypothetical protein
MKPLPLFLPHLQRIFLLIQLDLLPAQALPSITHPKHSFTSEAASGPLTKLVLEKVIFNQSLYSSQYLPDTLQMTAADVLKKLIQKYC